MTSKINHRIAPLLGLLFCAAILPSEALETPENFKEESLVAWCIVPFDAKKRSPEERAAMVSALGLKRVAYDWREKHVPEFEREMIAYRENGIEFFAFWKGHPEAYPLFKKHGIHPQIWKTIPSGKGLSTSEKVISTAKALAPTAAEAKEHGLKFGLYNHGGWGGLPENMVLVCEALRKMGYGNTGIVYNFHHAHHRIDSFKRDLAKMKPFLLCLNLNGMVHPKNHDVTQREYKIRPIGKGQLEESLIQTVIKSGYDGPIGVLGHDATRDVKTVLTENLSGLQAILGVEELSSENSE
ncbi:MAG: TIM barrel protein [Verrucomicrobiales bacterium]|nr:TIM barrel protein [Verrucomicrobiales bacterium]